MAVCDSERIDLIEGEIRIIKASLNKAHALLDVVVLRLDRVETRGTVAERRLRAMEPRRVSRVDRALPFLEDLLRSGPVLSSVVYKRGKVADHSRSALFEAKKKLGVRTRKIETGWIWESRRDVHQMSEGGGTEELEN
jgi:hypothetical protein